MDVIFSKGQAEVDREWVQEQLNAAGASLSVTNAVLRLWDLWHTMQWEMLGPDGEMQARQALEMFAQVAMGHAIPGVEDDVEEHWISAEIASPLLGDTVRVRFDAYSLSDGPWKTRLNGKTGKVVRMSRGVYVVSFPNGIEHLRASMLEKRYTTGKGMPQ